MSTWGPWLCLDCPTRGPRATVLPGLQNLTLRYRRKAWWYWHTLKLHCQKSSICGVLNQLPLGFSNFASVFFIYSRLLVSYTTHSSMNSPWLAASSRVSQPGVTVVMVVVTARGWKLCPSSQQVLLWLTCMWSYTFALSFQTLATKSDVSETLSIVRTACCRYSGYRCNIKLSCDERKGHGFRKITQTIINKSTADPVKLC